MLYKNQYANLQSFVWGSINRNVRWAITGQPNGGDGSLEASRLGTLYFYHNSFYAKQTSNIYRWYMFDTSSGGGNLFPMVEWAKIHAVNNAIWIQNVTAPYFTWNNVQSQFTKFGVNVINSNWGTGNLTSGAETSGFAVSAHTEVYQGASNVLGTEGLSNLIGVTTTPFDLVTFAPNSNAIGKGQVLPPNMVEMPARFSFGPNQLMTLRVAPTTLGALE